MAIDFDAIRRKVAQLSGTARKGSAFWRPEEGEHTVRIVPYVDNDGQPFKERWFYYNVGENITDPLEGRDIKVTLSKPPGQNWPKTTVMPRGKITKLNSDAKKIEEWTSNIPDLDEIYKLESYEEIEKKVNDWLNGSSMDDTDGTERATNTTSGNNDADTTKATAESKTTTESKSYSSLDDAFADLLGDD
jgi:hypothetical protein